MRQCPHCGWEPDDEFAGFHRGYCDLLVGDAGWWEE